MSILFHKRTKTTIKWVWAVFALVIAISMVFAFSGGTSVFQNNPNSRVATPPTAPTNVPTQQVPTKAENSINFSIDGIGG